MAIHFVSKKAKTGAVEPRWAKHQEIHSFHQLLINLPLLSGMALWDSGSEALGDLETPELLAMFIPIGSMYAIYDIW